MSFSINEKLTEYLNNTKDLHTKISFTKSIFILGIGITGSLIPKLLGQTYSEYFSTSIRNISIIQESIIAGFFSLGFYILLVIIIVNIIHFYACKEFLIKRIYTNSKIKKELEKEFGSIAKAKSILDSLLDGDLPLSNNNFKKMNLESEIDRKKRELYRDKKEKEVNKKINELYKKIDVLKSKKETLSKSEKRNIAKVTKTKAIENNYSKSEEINYAELAKAI